MVLDLLFLRSSGHRKSSDYIGARARETEDKFWNLEEEYGEIESEEEFEELKEEVFEEFSPPPYEFVKILRARKKR